MAIEFLRELVEINTTESQDDNTQTARAMADRLLAAGFAPEDVPVLEPATGDGNPVARYRGTDLGLKPLLLVANRVFFAGQEFLLQLTKLLTDLEDGG